MKDQQVMGSANHLLISHDKKFQKICFAVFWSNVKGGGGSVTDLCGLLELSFCEFFVVC